MIKIETFRKFKDPQSMLQFFKGASAYGDKVRSAIFNLTPNVETIKITFSSEKEYQKYRSGLPYSRAKILGLKIATKSLTLNGQRCMIVGLVKRK